MLLISDGARDGGQTAPRVAARRARLMQVPVYTVLVGTPNGVVHHELPGGYTETIRVPPSPQTLQLIANTTGAQFFRAASDKQLPHASFGRGGTTRISRSKRNMISSVTLPNRNFAIPVRP